MSSDDDPWLIRIPYWLQDVTDGVWKWCGQDHFMIWEWVTEIGTLYVMLVERRMKGAETDLKAAQQYFYDLDT
jgi:hypothetical protein